MTDTVITASHSTVVVSDSNTGSIVVSGTSPPQVVVTGMMGPPGSSLIADARDVDVSGAIDGSVLVYNHNTKKWAATIELSQQYIDGGQF